jgi:uncharacterized protein YunC (DUF1805 family)
VWYIPITRMTSASRVYSITGVDTSNEKFHLYCVYTKRDLAEQHVNAMIKINGIRCMDHVIANCTIAELRILLQSRSIEHQIPSIQESHVYASLPPLQ